MDPAAGTAVPPPLGHIEQGLMQMGLFAAVPLRGQCSWAVHLHVKQHDGEAAGDLAQGLGPRRCCGLRKLGSGTRPEGHVLSVYDSPRSMNPLIVPGVTAWAALAAKGDCIGCQCWVSRYKMLGRQQWGVTFEHAWGGGQRGGTELVVGNAGGESLQEGVGWDCLCKG